MPARYGIGGGLAVPAGWLRQLVDPCVRGGEGASAAPGVEDAEAGVSEQINR